jgi:hypothetical protein
MPFGSSQWMYSSGGFYPTEIDQSLRFDGTAYLSRTPSVAGNRKTWTWSGGLSVKLFTRPSLLDDYPGDDSTFSYSI